MLKRLLAIALTLHATNGFTLPAKNSVVVRNSPTHHILPTNFRSCQGGEISSRLYLSFKESNQESNNDSILSSKEEFEQTFSTPLDKPVLAALDFVSLMTFAAIGKASHAADGSLDIGAVLTTAFPFLLSWFATSPITGVYSDNTFSGEREEGSNEYLDAALGTLKGWAVAVPLGIAGRGLIKGYIPPLPFVVVTLISTLVILTIVRLLYTAVEGKLVQRT